MMNWDKFDIMDEIFIKHMDFKLDCDEFDQTNAIKHAIQTYMDDGHLHPSCHHP